MPPVPFGLNELSVKPIHIDTLEKGHRCARQFYECIRASVVIREDVEVWLAPGALDAIVCGSQAKPMRAMLRIALGNDRFAWLIGRFRNLQIDELLECEMKVNGEASLGLLFSHSKESWSVSLLPNPPEWDQVNIDALHICLLNGNLSERQCSIRHIARVEHVEHWSEQIAEYGFESDGSNVIAQCAELDVDMYPLDHGYPHIHLVNRRADGVTRKPVTVAKYRIDLFERMEGEPRYDSAALEFVTRNRAHLMSCWEACRRGEHPFQLDE